MKRNFKAYGRVRAYGYANRGGGDIDYPVTLNNPGRMDVKGNVVTVDETCGIATVICDDGVLRYYHVSQLRRLKRKAKA